MAISATSTYEAVCAAHRWNVPAQYNIAADVCDKHSRDKPAMIWESFDGSARQLDWGELQDLANQAAHVLAARGVGRGDRVAVVLPATPEDASRPEVGIQLGTIRELKCLLCGALWLARDMWVCPWCKGSPK